MAARFTDVDGYVRTFPADVQTSLKKHLSLYPVPRSDDELERDVAPYRATKDAVHLRYDQPLPRDVVVRIVALLVQRHTLSTG